MPEIDIAGQEAGENVPLTLPKGWTTDDIEYLLDELDKGPILVADTKLDIPTIHDFRGIQHLGFGLMKVEMPDCTILFDAGGAMRRTPSGQSWAAVKVPPRSSHGRLSICQQVFIEYSLWIGHHLRGCGVVW